MNPSDRCICGKTRQQHDRYWIACKGFVRHYTLSELAIDDDEHRERMEIVNYPCMCRRCVLPDGTRVESLYARQAKTRDQGSMLVAKPPTINAIEYPSLAELSELDAVP